MNFYVSFPLRWIRHPDPRSSGRRFRHHPDPPSSGRHLPRLRNAFAFDRAPTTTTTTTTTTTISTERPNLTIAKDVCSDVLSERRSISGWIPKCRWEFHTNLFLSSLPTLCLENFCRMHATRFKPLIRSVWPSVWQFQWRSVNLQLKGHLTCITVPAQ